MSFSKARIQRFNELGNEVPPPGAYDPKFDVKVKGLVIEKTERFHDNESVSSANCNLSVPFKTDKPPVNFRTPQLPRKRATAIPTKICITAKPRALHRSDDQLLKYNSNHQLADLQVECLNKNKTIQEQERHIEDMKQEIRELETQLEKLRKKQEEIEEQHTKDMEKMAKMQQDILNEYDENHQAETKMLRCQLLELLEVKERQIATQKKAEAELHNRIADITKKLTFVETELANENKMNEVRNLEAESKTKELGEEKSFLQQELENVQRLYKDFSNRLKEAHNELEEADKKHNIVLKKHKEDLKNMKNVYEQDTGELEQLLKVTKVDYLNELEKLTEIRNKDMIQLREESAKKVEEETRRLKEHTNRMVENAEALTRETIAACRAECEEREKRVIAAGNAQVNALIREATSTVEEEMRLTAERYKVCLARMEVDRATLDERLAQRDAKITQLSVALEELKSSAETQESFGQSLQIELDRAETELAQKKEELRSLKDQIRAEAAVMVGRRKRFEVIMVENQASVTALSKRLGQSNAEVERLQHQLKRGEECIDEHRDLLSIMRNNSQVVHEQVQTLMEQLDANKGLIDQLEANGLTEFESIKSVFEVKIENLKQIAAKEITRLQEDCDKKGIEANEMKSHLLEMADRLTDAQEMLVKLEEKTDAQCCEITRLEVLNYKIEEQLKIEKELVEKSNELLQSRSKQHEAALNEANTLVQELSHKVKCLEEREQSIQDNTDVLDEERIKLNKIMQDLEEERIRREAAELKIKNLAEYNERLVIEFEEISEKYAESIGHQNPRQRIKHVSQLKDKLCQMEQELHAKSSIIEQQRKAIDKLRAEEKRAHSKGKENMLGISRTAHSTPVSSPHKPLKSLGRRND